MLVQMKAARLVSVGQGDLGHLAHVSEFTLEINDQPTSTVAYSGPPQESYQFR